MLGAARRGATFVRSLARFVIGVPRVTGRAEFRQLCANLLNSNLTGSHLPPLVRACTLPFPWAAELLIVNHRRRSRLAN